MGSITSNTVNESRIESTSQEENYLPSYSYDTEQAYNLPNQSFSGITNNQYTTPSFNATPDYSQNTQSYNQNTTPSYNQNTTPSFNTTSDYSQNTPSFNQNMTPSYNTTPDYSHTTQSYSQNSPSYNQNMTPSNNATPDYSHNTPSYNQNTIHDYSQNTQLNYGQTPSDGPNMIPSGSPSFSNQNVNSTPSFSSMLPQNSIMPTKNIYSEEKIIGTPIGTPPSMITQMGTPPGMNAPVKMLEKMSNTKKIYSFDMVKFIFIILILTYFYVKLKAIGVIN
jgi:hypothetical protein